MTTQTDEWPTLEQLREAARATRMLVEAVKCDPELRRQIEAKTGAQWKELLDALLFGTGTSQLAKQAEHPGEGESFQKRCMAEFNEQRDAAIKRVTNS